MYKKEKIILSVIFVLSIVSLMFLFRYMVNQKTPISELQLLSESQWDQLKSNEQFLAVGQVEYKLRCYKCHGVHGEGTYKGVSLIDNEWLYGSDENSILKSTYYGVGTMRGYGKKMLPKDLHAITVYVKYLHDVANKPK